MSEVLARLLETGLVDGQQALLPGGHDLSPAATGAMEQARTAVVLAAHLIADKVCFVVGFGRGGTRCRQEQTDGALSRAREIYGELGQEGQERAMARGLKGVEG